MPDDTIKIAIEAVDNASKVLAEAGDSVDKLGRQAADSSRGLISVNDALADLIRQERAAKTLEDATQAMGLLTEAEKDQIVAAQELGKAQEAAGKGAEDSVRGFESFRGELVALQSGIGIAKEMLAGLEQAWNFAKEGAENQRIAESFSRTADSIGANADDIVKKLDEAAKGTVDDEELMQASTRALTLGVAKNSDDLVNVMKLARAAALQFGGDAGQAFESINQAIGNLAPRALKQYGIIVSLKDANAAYAKSLGVTADSLTEEQQRQALLNAVLEQGQKVFKDVGDQAATTGEKMKKFETQVGNLWDIVKEGTAGAFLPFLDNLDFLSKLLDGNASELEKTRAAYQLASSTFGETSTMAQGLKQYIEDLEKKQANLAQTTQEKTVRASMAQIKTFGELKTSLAEVEQGVRNQADVYNTLDQAMDSSTAKANLLAASQKLVAGEMSDLKTAMAGALQNETEQFSKKEEDLATKAAKLKDEIDKLQATQGRAITTTKKHGLTANEAALAQIQLAKAERELAAESAKGTLNSDQIAAAEEKVRLNREKLDGVTKTQIAGNKQLTAASEALKAAQAELANNTDPEKQAKLAIQVDNLKEKLGQASGAVTSYVDNSKKIGELQGQYNEINKEIAANAAAHEEATRRILFGYAEQQLAVGGLTETEYQALDALAEQWGLKSAEDIAAMKAIRDAAAGLAKDGSINEFVSGVTGALDQANGALNDTQLKLLDVAKEHGALASTGPVNLKVEADTKPAQQSVEDLAKNLHTMPPVVIKAELDLAGGEKIKAAAGDSIAERAKQARGEAQDTSKSIQDSAKKTIDVVSDIASKTTDKINGVTVAASSKLNTLATSTDTKFGSVSTSVINAMTDMGNIAGREIDDILGKIVALPTYKEFIYQITVKGTLPEGLPGFAQGGSYTVPPNPAGGSGDYFPVSAAPGERITVETPAQQAAHDNGRGSRGDTYNYTTNVYNPLAAAIVMDRQRRERLARSNARMGVTV